MRNSLRTLAVLASLTIGTASAAHADPTAWNWNGSSFCGGNAFTTCASVSATLTYMGGGITHVTISVTNNSGNSGTYAGTIFTAVGLANMPAGSSYVPNSLTVVDGNSNPVSGWSLDQDGKVSGLSGVGISKDVVGSSTTNGINNGIASPQTYTFSFDLTGYSSQVDISAAEFAIHGQGGPNGCSTKLVITNGVANTLDPSSSAGCTPTVVPEPVTMSLLATGLAGMGGAGFLRRRKQQVEG